MTIPAVPVVPIPTKTGELLPQRRVAKAFAQQWIDLIVIPYRLTGGLHYAARALEEQWRLEAATKLLAELLAEGGTVEGRGASDGEKADHAARLRACRTEIARARRGIREYSANSAREFVGTILCGRGVGQIEADSFAALHGEDAAVLALWVDAWNFAVGDRTARSYRASAKTAVRASVAESAKLALRRAEVADARRAATASAEQA